LIITPTPSATKSLTSTISYSASPSKTAGTSQTPTRTASHSVTPTVGYQIPTYVTMCPQPNTDATGRTGPLTIDQAFTRAWQTPVSNGGCAHLATYSNEQEFTAIFQSMLAAGATQAIIGGRKQTDSSYQWGAGTIRGQNWVEPVDQTTSHQIARPNCLQPSGFCLRDMAYVEPITLASQTGMVILLDNQLVAHLVPSSGSGCYVYAYETYSYIPNADGGPPYILYPALSDFDTHQLAAINNRQFIGRIETAIQNQWTKDELQCGTYNLWLGYETVSYPSATKALRLSAGPGDGSEILPVGSTTCNANVYCNFPSGWSGVTATDSAVSFASTTGLWSVVPQSSTRGTIRARENCPATGGVGTVNVCVPNFMGMPWLQTPTTSQAVISVRAGDAFYAGGPYTKNIGGVSTVFYFDCSCATYSRVNLDCLAADDPTQCQLYF